MKKTGSEIGFEESRLFFIFYILYNDISRYGIYDSIIPCVRQENFQTAGVTRRVMIIHTEKYNKIFI